jgi:hypothetical protein
MAIDDHQSPNLNALGELGEEHLEYSWEVMGHTVGVPNQVDIRFLVVLFSLLGCMSRLDFECHALTLRLLLLVLLLRT